MPAAEFPTWARLAAAREAKRLNEKGALPNDQERQRGRRIAVMEPQPILRPDEPCDPNGAVQVREITLHFGVAPNGRGKWRTPWTHELFLNGDLCFVGMPECPCRDNPDGEPDGPAIRGQAADRPKIRGGSAVLRDREIRNRLLNPPKPQPTHHPLFDPSTLPDNEAQPEYDWWERLPHVPEDVKNALVRIVGKEKRGRVSSARMFALAGGAYRDVCGLTDSRGRTLPFVLKRNHRLHPDGPEEYDGGCHQEALVYYAIAEHVPEALPFFATVYASDQRCGDWLIMERVTTGTGGPDRDEYDLLKACGVFISDDHGGNVGERRTPRPEGGEHRQRLFIDYGLHRVDPERAESYRRSREDGSAPHPIFKGRDIRGRFLARRDGNGDRLNRPRPRRLVAPF